MLLKALIFLFYLLFYHTLTSHSHMCYTYFVHVLIHDWLPSAHHHPNKLNIENGVMLAHLLNTRALIWYQKILIVVLLGSLIVTKSKLKPYSIQSYNLIAPKK